MDILRLEAIKSYESTLTSINSRRELPWFKDKDIFEDWDNMDKMNDFVINKYVN